MRPVIVMAGTPVDTQMGMDCLAAQGVEGVFCSISKDPVEQTAFQISSEREKAAVVTALFREAQAAHGCEQAFIYCNSLSGSVDFDAIARETGVAVVTPLDVYRALAPQYRSLAVIAANAQGAAGIERTLLLSNPDLTLRSAGILPVVLAIERARNQRSWWSATVCRSWRTGLPHRGRRRCCWAARTSHTSRRHWAAGPACRF